MSSQGDQGHGTSITSLLSRCSPAHEGTRRPHTRGLTTSWAITSRPPCQDPTMPITGAAGLTAQDRSGWSLSRPPSSDPAGLAIMSLVILPTHGLDSRPSCPLWPHQSLVRPNSAHSRINPQAHSPPGLSQPEGSRRPWSYPRGSSATEPYGFKLSWPGATAGGLLSGLPAFQSCCHIL